MNDKLAWRFFNDGSIGYVESIEPNGKGDRYSYTCNHQKALAMSYRQCLTFCRYMADCGTRGYHS